MKQRTLILIKPDAMQRSLAGKIISRLEGAGLRLLGAKVLIFDEEVARRFYAPHVDKDFFPQLLRYIASYATIAMVWEGEEAIARVRELMGATDPKRAAPGTLRAEFGLTITENSIHGSDSPGEAEREIAVLFSPEELITFKE